MTKFFIITFCVFTFKIIAQEILVYDHQNLWLNQTLTYGISPQYSLHAEIQWRREHWWQHPQQSLIRWGVNRDFGNGLSTSIGHCYVHTSIYGKIPAKAPFPEHRTWMQLQQKNVRGRLEMTERIRLEQRFVHSPVKNSITQQYEAGASIYSNRIRFLQKINIALNKKTIENGSLYLSLWDEFFVSFGQNVPINIFDQNRGFIGLGMQLAPIGRIEIGYLNQLINKGYSVDATSAEIVNKREHNHIIAISTFTTVQRKSKSDKKKEQ